MFRGFYVHFVEISTFRGHYLHFLHRYVVRGYYLHFVEIFIWFVDINQILRHYLCPVDIFRILWILFILITLRAT